MKVLWISVYACACIAAAVLTVAACNSSGRDEARLALRKEVDAVLAAHGVIPSEDEAARINRRIVDLDEASGFDWQSFGATVSATIAIFLPLLRILPNRYILGSAHDPEVARVAGMSSP